MTAFKKKFSGLVTSLICFPFSIYAAEVTTDMEHQLAQLKNKMHRMEMRLASAEQAGVSSTALGSDQGVNTLASNKKKHKKNHTTASSDAPPDYSVPEIPNTALNLGSPFSWQGSDISVMMVGGVSAGYSKPSGGSGSFNLLDFNPIFLMSYRDFVFVRSAVDFSIDNQGNASTNLDYSNLNLILNDYAVFGVGKFDSALGYFVQNLSPTWINRLVDAPVGFNDQQAAPQAEIGVQLRGGLPLRGDMRANYILYVANGPQAFGDTTNLVIDYIATDGYTSNNGDFVAGGRLGFLPIPKLEVGVSGAGGQAALIDTSDGTTLLQKGRGYSALGADISYKWRNWDLRGEYLQQQISAQRTALISSGGKWKAWYLQAAYWIPSTKFEPVVRYSKFTSPIVSEVQKQWAFGLDYWFAPSIAAQAEYELNSAQAGSGNTANVFLIQLVFGF